MNYVGKLFSNFKGFYNEINSATLTGAIDVVVVEQEDGSYVCSPFHVRFGKLGVIRSREKIVNIAINDEEIKDLHMKLGEDGVAFFVQETEDNEAVVPEHLATSPIPSAEDLMRKGIEELKQCNRNRQDSVNSNDSLRPRTESEKSIDCVQPRNDSQVIAKSKSSNNTTSPSSVVPVDRTNIDVEKVGQDSSPDSQKSCEMQVITVENEQPLARSKRKRKKKNKGKNEKISTTQNIIKEEETIPNFDQEGVFEMDEETNETKIELTTMARTVSLPLLEADKMNMTQEWAYSQYASTQHPFSDTDITPIVSPVGSRPPTPKSDLEYSGLYEEEDDEVKWMWGQLPETVPKSEKAVIKSEGEKTPTNENKEITLGEEDKPSGGLFQFMRKTKKIRHQPEQEGIYLDDLNLEEMDPEVAALYFPKSSGLSSQNQLRTIRDEDTESGRGSSVPHSPHSVDGAVGGSVASFEDQPSKRLDAKYLGMAMSLCSGLSNYDGSNSVQMEKFQQGLVTYDDFCQNPDIVNNPNLVIRIADRFYNWQTAAPMVLSLLVFQRPLPEPCITSLAKKYMPKKEKKKRSWFSWGRTADDTEENNTDQATAQQNIGIPPPATSSPISSVPSSPPDSPQKAKEKKLRKTKRHDDGWATDSSDNSDNAQQQTSRSSDIATSSADKYMKTLYLTSDQIAKLNLQQGINEITFFVTTAYQGTTRATCNIYNWRWDDKVIVSDIDGTITKSDVLGQLLPMVGRDYSQSGVAGLFDRISKNNYRFMYLSARAIGQAKLTRDYLRSVKQGAVSLPDGPLMLAPSSLITAFQKEVIEKKPEEFKISCLRNIQSLFPSSIKNPLYAGYGNKINDVYAYRAVGIPISRIFTINPKGELRSEYSQTFTSSYTKLGDMVDHIFPPLSKNHAGVMSPVGNFHGANQYSSFTYWRQPLPDISKELDSAT